RSSSGSLRPASSVLNGWLTPSASPRSGPPAQPAPAPQPARSSTAPAPPAGLIDRDTQAICILTGRLMHEYDKSSRIDEEASPEERENLLAVTQVLAGLRYNEVGLFQLLGGRNAMIESPVLQELKAEWTREAVREARRRTIVDFLVARFGPEAEEIATQIETIADDARITELVK